jgi:predicted secreted Zn-dependent protease
LTLNAELDLSSLESIKTVAEEIVKTEMQRYRKLEPFFDNEYDNMELFDLSSRIAKRMTSTLKDYSAIKDIYEKGKKAENWKDIL